jgi:hypothetical protein
MPDATESARRQRLSEINSQPGTRKALEAQHGQVWNTEELSREFEAIGFMAPFIVVRRRSDLQKGSMEFQHHPRFYFGFRPA